MLYLHMYIEWVRSFLFLSHWQVAVGSSHGLLMTLDGDVYSWGRNAEGQIGNNSKYEMVSQMYIPKKMGNISKFLYDLEIC